MRVLPHASPGPAMRTARGGRCSAAAPARGRARRGPPRPRPAAADAKGRVQRRHRILVDDRERPAEELRPARPRRGRAGRARKAVAAQPSSARSPGAGRRSPWPSASSRSPTRRRCRRSRPGATRSDTPRTGTEPPGKDTVRSSTASTSPRPALGLVRLATAPARRLALRPALPSRARLARRDLGQRLAEQREGQGGEDDRDRRADGDDRRDVDAADPLRQHAAPVVVGRLHGEAEEAEAGEGEQRLAHGERAV